jgi:DNA/RNA-binding domain of Phe-tRNA-synthetase-like protein
MNRSGAGKAPGGRDAVGMPYARRHEDGLTRSGGGPLPGCLDSNSLLEATETWRSAFRGAVVGALVIRAARNREQSAALEAEKRRLEEQLRAAAGPTTHGGPVARAYVDYYRAHGKTYQVKAQRESVARKSKPIPSRAALVEAMFMAELKNLILTAGHDLDAIAAPVRVNETAKGDRYVLLNGTEVVL